MPCWISLEYYQRPATVILSLWNSWVVQSGKEDNGIFSSQLSFREEYSELNLEIDQNL